MVNIIKNCPSIVCERNNNRVLFINIKKIDVVSTINHLLLKNPLIKYCVKISKLLCQRQHKHGIIFNNCPY